MPRGQHDKVSNSVGIECALSTRIQAAQPLHEGDRTGQRRADATSACNAALPGADRVDDQAAAPYGESFELPRLTRAISVGEVYDDILDGAGRSLLR